MSHADAMRLLWIPGVTACSGARSWTTEKLFLPSNVTVSSVENSEFVLYVGNPKQSVTYFAHEADRFAAASFESLLSGAKSEAFPKSTGWLLIRTYYAAFFAAHALLRLHGWACTRLLPNNLKGINRDLSTFYPEASSYQAGLYLLKSENGGKHLRCKPLGASLGGTHEALWSVLGEYFTDLSDTVLSSPSTIAQELVVAVDDFFTVVNKYGGLRWFTATRNRLNYAHEFGAWFPYTNSTLDYDRLHNIIAKWCESPEAVLTTNVDDEIVKFASACGFLVALCKVTFADLSFRAGSSSLFRTSCGRLASGL